MTHDIDVRAGWDGPPTFNDEPPPEPAEEPTGADPLDDEERAFHLRVKHNERVAEIAREIRARDDATALVRAERAGAAPPFDAGLLGEILARAPAPPPRVEDLIPAEAATLVVAQRKTGKTTFNLNLARSLITGHEFLGRFGVRPIDGNVALLNFEVSSHTIAAWAHEHGIPNDRLLLVNLRGRRNPLADPADRERLTSLLRQHDVESLFVDPFGRAFTGRKQDDAGEVTAFLTGLDQLARQDGAGCTDLVLSAHAGWNGERSRGSTALEDWADSVVTITRDENEQQRFLRAEGRDVLVDEDQLTFDPRSRRLTVAGTGSRKTTAKIRQVEALMPAVMDLLRDTPSMSGNQLDGALTQLIRSGDLDTKHSKGDGARAAQLLERRHLVASKDGQRGARLFTLLTSPTSPDLPEGTPGDLPTSPYRGVAEGSEALDLPTTQESER